MSQIQAILPPSLRPGLYSLPLSLSTLARGPGPDPDPDPSQGPQPAATAGAFHPEPYSSSWVSYHTHCRLNPRPLPPL
ncbi:hypothetical protein GQ53DRAFT_746813 [Thozetella sp. PMI_491]|nr:hypothetical protein GQ53DRAFT_746813 [Thozetella sp. PMI_491]